MIAYLWFIGVLMMLLWLDSFFRRTYGRQKLLQSPRWWRWLVMVTWPVSVPIILVVCGIDGAIRMWKEAFRR